jgi:ubiquitin-protein ligase
MSLMSRKLKERWTHASYPFPCPAIGFFPEQHWHADMNRNAQSGSVCLKKERTKSLPVRIINSCTLAPWLLTPCSMGAVNQIYSHVLPEKMEY